MTYYIKGGSRYNEANPTVWCALTLNGFTEAKYLDTDWKQIDFEGIIDNQDPFWLFGSTSGGAKEVEIGLYNDRRIKIDTTGIFGWDGAAWQNLIGGGAGGNLGDLDDVVITTPADNEVLAYNNATSQWINQTPAEAGLEPAFSKNSAFNKNFGSAGTEVCVGNDARLSDARTPLAHILGTSGPHTGTLPWSDLSKTGSSLGDLATRSHSNLSDAPTSAHHVRYADSEAVSAVEAAGLTMSNPINLQENLLTVGNAGVADPITLITFETERSWHFRKRSTGASTTLNLECGTAGKSFNIGYTNLPIIGFYADSTDANQYIHAHSHKITNLANGTISSDAMAFGQKYSLEQHDNTYHSTNYKPDFSENSAFNKNFGTLGTEVCVGNDSRLSDSRTPLAHVLSPTSGPHTGTLLWTELSKTGSNLTHLATRQHAGLTDVTANQHHVAFVQADADALYSVLAHLHDGDTLQCDGITSDGGPFTFSFNANSGIDVVGAGNTTFTITNSGAGRADFNVDRNITLGGTVDGVDIAGRDHAPTVAGDLNLNDLAEKSHDNLDDISANDHHVAFVKTDADLLYSVLAHIHDGRYYTETEINDMDIHPEDHDNTHHTTNYSAVGHEHDIRYFTETELNNGQLDNRYYTETEINANTYTRAQVDTQVATKDTKEEAHAYVEATALSLTESLTLTKNTEIALTLTSGEDVEINLHADRDNNYEMKHPRINLYQDGGAHYLKMGVGDITGIGGNNAYYDASAAHEFKIADADKMDITTNGLRLGAANARVTTILDEDAMGSNSATALATQQSIKAYSDLKLLLAGGTMSGAIAMGTNKITGMGDPIANQDAATKKWVDDHNWLEANITDLDHDAQKIKGSTVDIALLADNKILKYDNANSKWVCADDEGGAAAGKHRIIALTMSPRTEQLWDGGRVNLIVEGTDYVGATFYLSGVVDASQDIKFYILLRTTFLANPANMDYHKFQAAIKTDGSEAHSWNIENATGFTLLHGVNPEIMTITFANATFEAGDALYFLLRLNDAVADVYVDGIFCDYYET